MIKQFLRNTHDVVRDYRDKRRLKKAVYNNEPICIVIGAADTQLGSEFFSTNIRFLDVTKENDWFVLFNNTKIRIVVAEHVFEHMDSISSSVAFKNIFEYLESGGRLRIAVPDGYNPNQEYIDNIMPGGCGPGAHDHKQLYNIDNLSEQLLRIGFQVQPIEYFDESGHYLANELNNDFGFIHRSSKNGTPNKSFSGSHLSLIVDAIKP